MPAAPIVFDSHAGEFLSIEVTREEHAGARDFWDGNWVCATVHVRAGAFRGEYEAALRTPELVSFRAQLGRLYETLRGEATFETLEHWLRIHIQGDGRGHFVAECEARDQPGGGTELRFALNFDQTELAVVLDALDDVSTAFPVKGGDEHGDR